MKTLYSSPRARTGKGRGKEGTGQYPELSLLRFSEDVSPALAAEVGRKVALLPSFEIARRELARAGVYWNIKKVHDTGRRVGYEILTLRRRDLEAWRNNAMVRGVELRGKRVGVGLDGGRTRLREAFRPQRLVKYKGRHKLRPRSWKAKWREPKSFVIFELNDKGRMKAGTKAYIDSTLQGPDAYMELLAMRLFQLGAVDAEEVVFFADGAPWIWNRLDAVAHLVGLDSRRITMVLDHYHAVQHIYIALKALAFDTDAHARASKRLRRQLKRGRVDLILKELRSFEKVMKPTGEHQKILQREIAYFEKHKDRMRYKRYRDAGQPMGSGAIESVIRRVLNQRLKGNGIQWNQDNAEAIMVLRGMVLSERLDDILEHARATMATNRVLDWEWSSPDMRKDPSIPDEQDPASEILRFEAKELTKKRA